MIETQREARKEWEDRKRQRAIETQRSEYLLHIARRYLEDWVPAKVEYPYSLWGEAYHNLVKPLVPRYIRWIPGLVVWIDTLRWRRQYAQK